mmetsp:Transcript_11026/g.23570  ORF Transcript_11026/g.23570 Transcript_11026/m.23570 type:complete len:557 (+) Transcript_11026:1219-2889(+)
MTVLEVALQCGSPNIVKLLLEDVSESLPSGVILRSLEGISSRALTFPMDKVMLEVLENESSAFPSDAVSVDESESPIAANTNTFEMVSGRAWVGNISDFDSLLQKSDGNVSEIQSNIVFHNVVPGKWFVFTTPWMQVVAHHQCADDYLVGAVCGAIYGGFKEGQWNPLIPPAADVTFTGRMEYSEDEPRHVTWFTDPNSSEFDKIRHAPVPEGNTLMCMLRNKVCVSGTTSHSAMWTCMQEYRYGVYVGGRCFISIGYEGMDLDEAKISIILDSIVRAKRHCCLATLSDQPVSTDEDSKQNSSMKRKFLRTEFSDSASVPKKRTRQEIFEKKLEEGDRFSGIDFLQKYTPKFPSQGGLIRFGPVERVFLEEDIAPFLSKLENCVIAESLIDDFTLLLDELIMMLLHFKVAPAVVAGFETSSDAQGVYLSAANAAFPNFAVSPSVDSFCHDALTAKSVSHGCNLCPAPLSERILKFLLCRGVPRLALSENNAIVHIYNVCCYIISELLELTNNNRLDCGHSKLVPQHLRQAVLNDPQLFEACNGKQVCELYYPSHME